MDFNAMLDGEVGTAKPPVTLPEGTFTWQIISRRYDKSKVKKTDFVEFELKAVGYDDDVRADELPEGWEGKKRRETFYLTEDALFRLDDFLKAVDPASEGQGRRQQIDQAASDQKFVKGHLIHSPYTRKNGEPGVSADVDTWAPA